MAIVDRPTGPYSSHPSSQLPPPRRSLPGMADNNMQLIELIDFTRTPDNDLRNRRRSGTNLDRRSASPDRGPNSEHHDSDPDPDPDRNIPPTQRRASAENPGMGTHLEEHAIISARRMKLPAASEEDVLHVARLSAEERSIEIYSTLAAIKNRLDKFGTERSEQRDDFQIPLQLKDDIRYKTALILASTAEDLRYRDGPNKPAAMIKGQYRKKQGFDTVYLQKGPKGERFSKFVDKTCTDGRAKIKERILKSIDTKEDVLNLTTGIQDGLADWSHKDVKATKLLAVWIAFLRAILRKNLQNPEEYWSAVDKQLDAISKRCLEPGTCTFTGALTQIYDRDIADYPPTDPALLDSVVRTGNQQVMDKYITPSSS